MTKQHWGKKLLNSLLPVLLAFVIGGIVIACLLYTSRCV